MSNSFSIQIESKAKKVKHISMIKAQQEEQRESNKFHFIFHRNIVNRHKVN